MSGVILEDGTQYERCNQCEEYVEIQALHYSASPKWPEHEKVDVCPKCWKENQKIDTIKYK